MRRLKDTPGAPGHLELLKCSPSQRLFVQRWIELFDWDSDIHFQFRPVSPAEVKNELDTSEGFHRQLLQAELSGLKAANTQPFPDHLIDTDPTFAAERLAALADARVHHPLYLFHAINIFLGEEPEAFPDRVTRLQKAWADCAPSEYRFYFRTTSAGRPPASRKTSPVKLLRWDALPESARAVATRWCEATESGQEPLSLPSAFEIVVVAEDTNAALEDAIRRYHDYRACVVASSPGLSPIALDLSEAVVVRAAASEARLIPVQARRFRMRGGSDIALFTRLDAATEVSDQFAVFVRNFAEALQRLREGDLDSALESLVLNQDLAFWGCNRHASEGWRLPRYLVEVGSQLVALDWPRRYFDYIVRYCRQTSHTVDPHPQIPDQTRSRVLLLAREPWPFLIDDGKWTRVINRTQWDELLKHRRSEFVQSLANLPASVARVRKVAAWDLARAVRARNTLVHRGIYLSHHRSIGILLDAYELVIRLRLMASERNPSDPLAGFNRLVDEIEGDFDALLKGTIARQALRSLCEEGWNGLWTDPPATIIQGVAQDVVVG